MRRKGESGRLPDPCQHLAETVRGERRAPLRQEYVSRAGGLFPLDLAQRAEFTPADRMHARDTVLQPVYVQQPAVEIDLIPAQRDKLPDAKAVPKRDEDHGRIP